MVPKHYFEKRIVKKGLQADSASPSHLFECMAMFYFVKGLSLRIVTIPWKEKMLILLFVRFICVHLHQKKLFDRNTPHITEFVTIPKSLPRSMRNTHK